MTLRISSCVLARIHTHCVSAYPEEGVGFLLGSKTGANREVSFVLPAGNASEAAVRRTRFVIRPEETLNAEKVARQQKLDLLGVFHSHPDHPPFPSEFDRESAIPWFIYLITSIEKGKAGDTRVWRLSEDASRFIEEVLTITNN